MSEFNLRFYGELNDFLPQNRRQVTLQVPLKGPVTVKHSIEALGVPHPEVELIVVAGTTVDFGYQVQAGDRVGVYPVFMTIDLGPHPALRPPLAYPPAFVIDNHLGRLTMYLRLLGFDARYRNDFDDVELAEIADQESRVLLTRDRRLLMRKQVDHGYWLRSKNPREQIAAVLRRFKLHAAIRPWRCCLRCNGPLMPIEKEKILDRLEPKTKKYYHEFRICQECQQIYWKGSHFEPLSQFIRKVGSDGAGE